MRAQAAGILRAIRRRSIHPSFLLRLTAGFGFEIEAQSHGEGRWILSISLYAPWNLRRLEIPEAFRYDFAPRSLDLQLRLKRATWSKTWGTAGNPRRRFLYLGPVVLALDRLRALPEKQELPQRGRWDWGVPQ